MHISYGSISSIAVGSHRVYGATTNGVLAFDRDDNSVTSYNKITGLTSSGITAVGADNARDQLLVAYADGVLDLVTDAGTQRFDRLKNSTTISGSRRLNAIRIRGNEAYIAADYGVVVFDLARREVKETWRDLGPLGSALRINQLAINGDTIFLATDKGVLAGDLKTNLLDYNLWKRFDQNTFAAAFSSIAVFQDKAYVTLNGTGIYAYTGGTWSLQPFLPGKSFQSLEASAAHLVITEDANIWTLSASGALASLTVDAAHAPLTAQEDERGKFWIGDSSSGLISNVSGGYTAILPDGPVAKPYRLGYAQDALYALAGGPSTTFQPLHNAGTIDTFQNGAWQNSTSTALDLTDVATDGAGNRYLASFGYGLEKRDAEGNTTRYDETNSPLSNTSPPSRGVTLSAIEASADGLWVANYGAVQSLKLLKPDGTWAAFSFPFTASRYPVDLAVDLYGYVWMVLNPALGGGLVVFDLKENKYAYLSNAEGAGGLPNRNVRSIAIDRDGYVWVGTDQGVGYFIYPPDVFTGNVDAVKPIYDNRFLLRDDQVTALAIDGGNRKWMGTTRGVWLFNPTGETLVHNFTAATTPLLSDSLLDIEVHPATGEVFFATTQGLASYRSGATQGTVSFETVKIFPNPITKQFSGTVGITGLATDAIVKITDVSGKLIWQTQANGGMATWNVQDYNGRRASTGIYLVFAATPDGSESVVGKVAVID
jgi:ligand-binding sensor domain-containing protein